jgi:hypothetical protein
MLVENPLVETLPTTILEAKSAKLKHRVRYGNRIICKIKEYYELLHNTNYPTHIDQQTILSIDLLKQNTLLKKTTP